MILRRVTSKSRVVSRPSDLFLPANSLATKSPALFPFPKLHSYLTLASASWRLRNKPPQARVCLYQVSRVATATAAPACQSKDAGPHLAHACSHETQLVLPNCLSVGTSFHDSLLNRSSCPYLESRVLPDHYLLADAHGTVYLELNSLTFPCAPG